MRCSEIISELERLAPAYMACDWDNVGLLAGRSDKEVRKIWIALDATERVIEAAAQAGADMLLTHHPLIFKAVKKVNDQDFVGKRVLSLIRSDISYYAMHTSFDAAPGCMADLAAARLGLSEVSVLELMGEQSGVLYGIGKMGTLKDGLSLFDLAQLVKEQFGLPLVTVYGENQNGRLLRQVAVCPGSGGSLVDTAIARSAQVLVTGDIGHHDGIDAVARGMAVIDAGHYGLEHIFIEFMEQFLTACYGDKVEVIANPPAFPAAVI